MRIGTLHPFLDTNPYIIREMKLVALNCATQAIAFSCLSAKLLAGKARWNRVIYLSIPQIKTFCDLHESVWALDGHEKAGSAGTLTSAFVVVIGILIVAIKHGVVAGERYIAEQIVDNCVGAARSKPHLNVPAEGAGLARLLNYRALHGGPRDLYLKPV